MRFLPEEVWTCMKRHMMLLFTIFLCSFLPACASGRPHSRDTYAMDTVMRLTAYGDKGEEALDGGIDTIARMEALLSTTREDSEIYRINASGFGDVSETTADILSRTLHYADFLGGDFRPDLYEMTALWGFTGEQYRVPSEEEIEEVRNHVSGGSVSLEERKVTLSGVKLDLGAAAKGYTAQTVIDSWRKLGIHSGIISLGGNVQTLGLKPDGTLWRVGIVDPEDTNRTLCVLSVGEAAIVTSGGYQRFFEKDGVRYGHIMDPVTGTPASSDVSSVTVVSSDGLFADCCSTALYVKGFDAAVSFWREKGGFEMVLVDHEGRVYVTDGLSGSVSGCPFEVLAP